MDMYELFCQCSKQPEDEKEAMQLFFENVSQRMSNFQNFTNLQRETFQNEAFWDSNKNIILEGSTSAGKTLIAECSMANQIYGKGKKVIYLVPLKALTTEKERDFQNDFKGKRIYTSSADYQENDFRLTKGDYDIGILVYEKFFSLTAQNYKRFLKDCGLIVIDEMHMLSNQERGPKLEFAIEKVRFQNENIPSFLGLTTAECDMSAVREWLGKDITEEIRSNSRPVKIEERFLYCNQFSAQMILKRWQDSEDSSEKIQLADDGSFQFYQDVPGDPNPRYYQLYQVLKNHCDTNEKIIIFCNNKRECENMMQKICDSGIIKERSPRELLGFPTLDDSEMEGSHYNKLREALQKYGVAYHNANHSLSMRQFIEETFCCKDDGIRIIIATETLTMGVNMPTDIMILFHTRVNRGKDDQPLLTFQEYKNAVGRAGRYGISKNNCGISYVLSDSEENLEKVIDKYIKNPEQKKVVSGLVLSNNEEGDACGFAFSMATAPYYMSVLNDSGKNDGRENFSQWELEKLISHGLLRNVSKLPDSKRLSDQVIHILLGEEKYTKNPPKFAIENEPDFDFDEDTRYSIRKFGKAVSPFALSIRTYMQIQRLFLETDLSNLPEKWTNYHMPLYDEGSEYEIDPYEAEELENGDKTFFFDILYNICKHPEIAMKKQYLSINAEIELEIRNACLRFFRKHNSENLYWENSKLRKLCADDYCEEITTKELEILYRIVVLYYWTRGNDVRDIRKKLGLPNAQQYYIYTSDVQSLAEICAYHIEAIAMAFKYSERHGKFAATLHDMFYHLSIRIKYGMTQNLALIASKHISGLNRSRMLRLEKHAKEQHFDSAIEFVLSCKPEETQAYLTPDQDKALRERFDRVKNYDLEQLRDQLEQDSYIDMRFIGKFSIYGNSTDEFLDLMDCMRIPAESVDNKKCVHVRSGFPNDIWIYICRKTEELENSDEIKNIVGWENHDGITLIIYNNGKLSDKDHLFLLKSDFDLMILRSICQAGNYQNAGYYLIRLLTQYSAEGRKICRGKMMSHLLEKFSREKAHKTPAIPEEKLPTSVQKNQGSTTINNYYNIQTIQGNNNNFVQSGNSNVNISLIKNNIHCYRNDLQKEAKQWRAATSIVDVDCTEGKEIDEQFLDAEKQISLPEKITPENIEEIAKMTLEGEKQGLFEEIKSIISDAEGTDQILFQAIYVENAIFELNLLDDYSPAATLYGKAIEHFLKTKIFPVFKKDCPKFQIRIKGKRQHIEDVDCETNSLGKLEITLGTFYTVINTEYLEEGKKERTNTLDFSLEESKFWKDLCEEIKCTTKLRNDCSHSSSIADKHTVSVLREEIFKIFHTVYSLPERIVDKPKKLIRC